jgi:hypothetical protein
VLGVSTACSLGGRSSAHDLEYKWDGKVPKTKLDFHGSTCSVAASTGIMVARLFLNYMHRWERIDSSFSTGEPAICSDVSLAVLVESDNGNDHHGMSPAVYFDSLSSLLSILSDSK